MVEHCDWIEVRADLLPELDPAELRERWKERRLLYTLQISREETRGCLSLAQRHRKLKKAAEAYDFVNLDAEYDLVPDVIRVIPPGRRIVSWRGKAAAPEYLETRLGAVTGTPARLFRFEVESGGVEAGLAALQFLHRVNRADVAAYAEGASGGWTRMLAPRLGAPIAFASVWGESDPAGLELTIRDLVQDYGFPDLYPVREIFAIIGQPVSGSLSPRVHNGAYQASGFGRLFLSFPADSFQEFWNRLVLSGAMEAIGFPIMGLTVVSPHKEAPLEVATHCAPLCRQCVSSNLLVRRGNEWTASTTDPEGIFHNMSIGHPRPGTKVAIIGCGGSGRIAAAALRQAGANVTLVNRGAERGQWAAQLLGLPFVPLESFSARGYGAIVNATPVGRNGEQLPLNLAELDQEATVVDMVYNHAGDTALTEQARALGHQVVDGWQILLAQARRQYYLMTGETMPMSLGRRLLGLPAADGKNGALLPHQDRSNDRLSIANFANLGNGGIHAA
ncbi:MAG TPA: type I 3-dehydroquinate dehydratase [Chthoniobacterales bacterium]|nr:type I 3-dehydroquinate dehydratase [Chthoniobacterales bacterium]